MTNGGRDTLAGRILKRAQDEPNRRAVVCDDHSLSYRELVSRASACAGRLQTLGLEPGGSQRVGLLSANSLDFAVVVVACQLSGVPVVPLPGLVASDAQARMIRDANVTVLFHDAKNAERAHVAISLLGSNSKVLIVSIGASATRGDDQTLSFDGWLASDTSAFVLTAVNDRWLSDIIYSSGTTGDPKGIAQSYAARAEQSVSISAFGVTEDTGFLQTTGLYSNFGLSSLLLSLWGGGTFFMMSKFSGPGAVEILSREKIDMAWLPPATLIRTMEAPGFDQAVHGRSCVKLCAGAPISEAQKRQVLETWPGPFYEVFGQTETGTLTVLAMHAVPADKLGTVGTVLPTVSLHIIDDAGRILPAGEEGEIVGHSTTLMSGYHRREAANESVYWRDETGRLYIRTGDIGKLDAEGYLWLCDRKKDMIISGGYNIYPADIERVLSDHAAVFEVAVVGFASMRWGETPVAFLTLREGAEADGEDLRAWVNSRVGAVQRVAAVKILPELPSGAMGKILKRALRDRFAEVIGTLP
ncbi:class I adenylate-forming enzyme family protein [Lichenicoccus sp.]|uniref:class I adenylate-forming enzyme family protein n=1 Tax=Lichenicoccus sp. TaxID=2781899 RepID=UPI003D130126